MYAVIPYVKEVEYGKIKLNKVPLNTAEKIINKVINNDILLFKNSFAIKNTTEAKIMELMSPKVSNVDKLAPNNIYPKALI